MSLPLNGMFQRDSTTQWNKLRIWKICNNFVVLNPSNISIPFVHNALAWCYWIALTASLVMQSGNTVSCVSLSFRTTDSSQQLQITCGELTCGCCHRWIAWTYGHISEACSHIPCHIFSMSIVVLSNWDMLANPLKTTRNCNVHGSSAKNSIVPHLLIYRYALFAWKSVHRISSSSSSSFISIIIIIIIIIIVIIIIIIQRISHTVAFLRA